ncbi:uncharacterized protein KGF55_003188 [Candida pseudojiufengensis]|uniref:uncharacterized protein n=1 Tax=Candida pseudojiufengensis TaxID=497109 RepID=UPI002225ACE4|nr:uncharacterized protein KGF55_003188 [Candida pseudojiufengensis]KAI5962112.1 hypothetical protein KGF55_003188 [Candida pseudojiufengensis]
MTEELTSSALLEQLVYIDNYINGASSSNENNSSNATPNVDVDGQLSLDLAAFADDSFIFPDEDKPKLYDDDDNEGDEDDEELHKTQINGNQHNDLKGWNINEFNASYLMQNLKTEHNQHNDIISGSSKDINNNQDIFKDRQFENTTNEEITSTFSPLTNLPKFPVPPGAKSSLESAGLSQKQIDLLSALVAQHQNSLGKPIPNEEQQQQEEENNHYQFNHNVPITPTLTSIPNNNSDIHSIQSHPNQIQRHDSTSSIHHNSQIPAQQHLELSHHQNQHQPRNSQHIESQINLQGTSQMSFINPPSINNNNVNSSTFTNSNNLNNQFNLTSNQFNHTSSSTLSTSSNMSSPDAAELDKKRRNTAASARFRIKKKMKEQQMENKINSLQDLISNLENKLMNLEMENKLLRNLIIEKGSQESDDELKKLKEKAKMGFN